MRPTPSIATLAFKLGRNGTVRRLPDGAIVPQDPANPLRQAYTAWLAQGHTPEPHTADRPQPTSDELYEALMTQNKLIKAVVLALNDGTLVPGTNRTANQLRNIIKAKIS